MHTIHDNFFRTKYDLQKPTLPPQERRARIFYLSSLMYLATPLTWSSVRDLHAAVLFEIELPKESPART